MAPVGIPIKCSKCFSLIKKQSDTVLALQQTWHKNCFRCIVCRDRLRKKYFCWKDELYCKKHYLERYGHSCRICAKQISGLIMVSGDISFHHECFTCCKCKRLIGHQDNYVFVERSRLYCKGCYDIDIGVYLKFSKFKLFHKTAIHQIHIPTHVFKKDSLSFKLNSDSKEGILTGLQKKISSKHQKPSCKVSIESSEVSSLKVGDTLLEINGSPITSDNACQFAEILESTEAGKKMRITLERAPESHLLNYSPDFAQQKSQDTGFDPEVYERNISYFNFEVLDRARSDSAVSRYEFQQRKLHPIAEKLISSPREKLAQVSGENKPKKTNLVKSFSIGDLHSESNVIIKNKTIKYESPLYRAQSLKICEADQTSQIFRPSDLYVGESLGEGFYGEVLKITHKVTGKEMAMKKIFDIDEEAILQFMKEVHLLKSLSHPNVLQFIGVMFQDKTLHLLLEYIRDGTLWSLIDHVVVQFTNKLKTGLAKDIASGMAYLHSQNIIHRDLKSNNVLLKKREGEYRAIVADFGLASVMHEVPNLPANDSLSAVGAASPKNPKFRRQKTLVGTAFWMAPEILNGETYDQSVDVFSYGITLCEIVSRTKNDGDSIPRIRDYSLDVDAFKKLVDGDCSTLLVDLCEACCKYNPEERPSFVCCQKWLEILMTHIKFDIPLPGEINLMVEPKPLRLKSALSSVKNV